MFVVTRILVLMQFILKNIIKGIRYLTCCSLHNLSEAPEYLVYRATQWMCCRSGSCCFHRAPTPPCLPNIMLIPSNLNLMTFWMSMFLDSRNVLKVLNIPSAVLSFTSARPRNFVWISHYLVSLYLMHTVQLCFFVVEMSVDSSMMISMLQATPSSTRVRNTLYKYTVETTSRLLQYSTVFGHSTPGLFKVYTK